MLHDVSLYAEPGQKIASWVPPAGKNHHYKPHQPLYDINAGTITYDGIDVRNIEKKTPCAGPWAWCSRTPISLPAPSPRTSATAGPDATDEQVVAAARLANADGFIRHLPRGHPITGDGGSLSQGERQLLPLPAAVRSPGES